MTPRSIIFLTCVIGALLVGPTGATPGEKIGVVRDLAARVGPVIGSALACKEIARPRIKAVVDKFAAVIREASSNVAERADVSQLLDRSVADGRSAVTTGQIDCGMAEQQLTDLERSIAAPASSDADAPNSVAAPTPAPAPPAAAAAAVPAPVAPAPVAPAPAPAAPVLPAPVIAAPETTVEADTTPGVADREIRFGMTGPFSGAAKELGRQMKLGIDTAFNQVNDAGGIEGRMLRLIAADDGYDPARTLPAMKQLTEKDQVFGFIGNVGTPTAAVALPYALQRHMLFFGALTGANLLRHDPPDRYVFNYRASYVEETDAIVRYLVKMRRLQPSQIAVFTHDDADGDAGFSGVAKAIRGLGANDGAIPRFTYKRNTVDVDEAVYQLRTIRRSIKAIIMVASYRAAAKFIEKARNLFPAMVFANLSAVDGTALADELRLLGPHYAKGVIVTQVTPAVAGYSSIVLDYKNALAKYFPGEAPDYVSLEGYVTADILIRALKRTGPEFDTEKLVDSLENIHKLDLGLGVPLAFGRGEHQASHRIWGTVLDENARYQPIELE
jgi:ABC-type branched-subunit amino acid transport system substrate-binding protein